MKFPVRRNWMDNMKDKLLEKYLINELRNDKEEAFSLLFKSWYTDLVLYAGTFLRKKANAKILSRIFL